MNKSCATCAWKEDANMDKPRIAQVLGVEVGERFSISPVEKQLYVSESGNIIDDNRYLFAQLFVDAINHPDRIIRKPRWTQQEVEDAKYIKRILKVDSVRRNIYGNGLIAMKSDNTVSIVVNSEMLPSIHPGQSVTLDEIIGGAK